MILTTEQKKKIIEILDSKEFKSNLYEGLVLLIPTLPFPYITIKLFALCRLNVSALPALPSPPLCQ